MIEIIPNWHPLFVHFTLALFTTSVVFYWLSYLTAFVKKAPENLMSEFAVVARWCLWVAALATIATVSAGFYAYYTVNHDAPSHEIITTHRNWALFTGAVILLIAIWTFWKHINQRFEITLPFLLLLLLVQASLLTTAWFGGELVYRYGIGVMSLPNPETTNRSHPHAHGDHAH